MPDESRPDRRVQAMMLDHVTIRSSSPVATRDFFIDVFGLAEGMRPRAIARIPGHWLYARDEPIVHIIGGRGVAGVRDVAADAIDHVAFRLSDVNAFRARLDERAQPYSEMFLDELQETRIFLRAPGGPLIEAVFRDADPPPVP